MRAHRTVGTNDDDDSSEEHCSIRDEDGVEEKQDRLVVLPLEGRAAKPGIKALCHHHQGFYAELHEQMQKKVQQLTTESAQMWASCNECANRVGCEDSQCRNLDCSQLFKRSKVAQCSDLARLLALTVSALLSQNTPSAPFSVKTPPQRPSQSEHPLSALLSQNTPSCDLSSRRG